MTSFPAARAVLITGAASGIGRAAVAFTAAATEQSAAKALSPNPIATQGTTEPVTDPDWDRAPCRRNPRLWDDTADAANTRAESPAQRSSRHNEAIALCRACPVIEDCRREVAHASNPTGIWAGEIYPKLDRRARREVRPLPGHRTRTSTPPRTVAPHATHRGWNAADVAFADLIATIRAQRAARAARSDNE
ncbi:WhiB family transcriptional regulator [Rhodococcus opacus]|uniref:4Fe-4S Wbl-type domain-containing protein n=1 Tax=Rhodococcus opacus TaxID=37919 RepID=A0A2S8J4T4_RHOOP|nr:WhiB family transcriptional regulator [Rhodococcus opacus]PQP21939.1 hypothetical protein C5613_24685 [Rhodococcus opacus]